MKKSGRGPTLTEDVFNEKKQAFETLKKNTDLSNRKIYDVLGVSKNTGYQLSRYTWEEFCEYKKRQVVAKHAREGKIKARESMKFEQSPAEIENHPIYVLLKRINALEDKIDHIIASIEEMNGKKRRLF